MTTSEKDTSAATLTGELKWLEQVIDTSLKLYFKNPAVYSSIYDVLPPDITTDNSRYAATVRQHNMTFAERLILILALAPHVAPQILDVFFVKNATYDRCFTEFGGFKGNQHRGFLPTGQTVAFVLASHSLEAYFNILEIFNTDHFFSKNNILHLVNAELNEPKLSGLLSVSDEYLEYLITGEVLLSSQSFPVKKIETSLSWEDLDLPEYILNDVLEIQAWMMHYKTLLNDWGLEKTIKLGFRSLFYGSPGVGKTLTASLLGKSSGVEVYRVDLALLVSKYIGETEKNIAAIFNKARNNNWILFIDGGDFLFRTCERDNSNLYAGREISFLFKCLENFPGVAILSCNSIPNIAGDLLEKFQSVIHFPLPSISMRAKLWERTFDNSNIVLEDKINFFDIAKKYEISSWAINNIFLYCCLKAFNRNDNTILLSDVNHGIEREVGKRTKLSK